MEKSNATCYRTFLERVTNLLKFYGLIWGICLLALWSVIPRSAKAATLEVGPSGYTYTSIQSAITAAADGDTVLVHDGTYTETINFKGKAITVKSENGPDVTVIDGNASGSVVTFYSGEGNDSVLDGFKISNGSGGMYGGGVHCVNNSSPTITRCNIISNTSNNGGGIHCNGSSPIISKCIIAGNTGSENGGGIWIYGSSSPTITNCVISGNTTTQWHGGGIYCENSSSPKITNTTIAANAANPAGGSFGYGGGLYALSSSPIIINSIFWGNTDSTGDDEISESSSSVNITYSDVKGGYSGTGNINSDPSFIDPKDASQAPTSVSFR